MEIRELDNRGLSPPEPMVRILAVLGELGEGEELRAIMDREPFLLYAELERRGFGWQFQDEGGLSVLRISRSSV